MICEIIGYSSFVLLILSPVLKLKNPESITPDSLSYSLILSFGMIQKV